MTEPIWDQLAAIGESKPQAWDELPPLPKIMPQDFHTPAEVAAIMRAYAAAAVRLTDGLAIRRK